ncbi:MAG: uroporphyrinogen decarboxylase [Kiritimatiellae bacterium]|nr:uroporphyrinogen decarboxylase [Kiritimatiellia bacterium]
MARSDRFLTACRCKPTDVTPIWLMRQAGRYMPEYRKLREKYSILEMIKNPDLATEVTLQPVHAFEVDAAIIFADILPLLEAMGLELEFIHGQGPVIHNPISQLSDVKKLVDPLPEEALHFTLEAIEQTKKELDGQIPLIGFSGAPFTLACYAIEGGSSKTFHKAKTFMKAEPKAWSLLMEKLSKAIGAYLSNQAKAGAQVVQLFDSWAGHLTASEYEHYVLPYSRETIQHVKTASEVPLIHFGTKTSHILSMLKEAGGDVISIDSDMDLATAWSRLGSDSAIQGNLNPNILAEGPMDIIEQEATRILNSVKGRPGHIFNLGHGILKHTPVEHVARLVEYIHRYTCSS